MNGRKVLEAFLSLIGAALGAALGFFVFGWLFRRGYYAMVLPGALVGIGCGLLSKRDSLVRGILCGLASFMFGLFVEWSFRPFENDESFIDFVKRIGDLDSPAITLGLIGLGGILSFFFGKSRMLSWKTNSASPPLSEPSKKNEP